MSDSVRPHRWQPTRLPCPRDSPGKNTGVGYYFLLQCMKVKSEFLQSCNNIILMVNWNKVNLDPLEGGHGNPLQYCCLENFMDRGAWRATVHAVAESNMNEQLTLSHCIYVLSIYTLAWSLVLWFVSIIVALLLFSAFQFHMLLI